MSTQNTIGVIDLFCGIGGLSHGMFKEGFDIIAGFDIDDTCKYAYENNNKSKFYNQDIKTVTIEQINNLFANYDIKVLAGCAPCQPFSSYAFKVKDKDKNKYDLLVVIFVHGCFWHGHTCKAGHLPTSNLDYWKLKIEKNIERDRKKNEELEMQGWNVIVVWQCEVKTLKNRHQRLFTLVLEIMNNKMKTL